MRFKAIFLSVLLVALLSTSAAFAFVGGGPIKGTTWRVVGYNDSSTHNELKLLPADQQFTVTFDRNGRVAGRAGSNAFTSHYSVNGSKINIAPAHLAQRASSVSGTTYAQERSFLNAMNKASRWRMAGGQLDLLHWDGRIAATLLTTDEAAVVARRENLYEDAVVRPASVRPAKTVRTSSVPVVQSVRTVSVVPVESAVVRTASVQTLGATSGSYVYMSAPNQARIDYTDGDDVAMTVGGKTYKMKSVSAASGAKFEAVGDPSTTFWSKGERASITVKGVQYPEFEIVQGTTTMVRPMSTTTYVQPVSTTVLEPVATTTIVAPAAVEVVRPASTTTVVTTNSVPSQRTVYRAGERTALVERVSPDTIRVLSDGRAIDLERVDRSVEHYRSNHLPETAYWKNKDYAGDHPNLMIGGVTYIESDYEEK